MATAGVEKARAGLGELVKPGVVTDHNLSAAAAQKVTEERFKLYAKKNEVYPKEYPPPPAGDGKDVFKAADEGGEGTCTRKELAKYLMRNQTLKYRLGAGWAKFNSNFGTEDCAENHEELKVEDFVKLWAEAAAMRKEAEKEAKKAAKSAGESDKKVKAVKKEGGKKGQDLAGMGEMGSLFQQAVLMESAGNMEFMEMALKSMNTPVDPEGEERRGGAQNIAKILISSSDDILSVIVDVPHFFTKASEENKELGNTCDVEMDARVWLTAACNTLPKDDSGNGVELVGEQSVTKAAMSYKNDPDKDRFVLKAKDAVSGASFLFLREKSLILEDDSDEMIFGDDDMPGY
jgi:hypothetical protein